MDKLRAMQTFVAIIEHGSLTAAARALASSLPVMVRTLAQLEDHLGVRLLNRTTRRLALTEEGQAYLESCRDILAAVDGAEHRLQDRRAQASGLITVTASVLFGQMHVAPAIQRFLVAHPAMQCRLLLLDRVANLLEEGIDVGIRIGPLDDSTLVARPIGMVQRLVVASPDFVARHGAPESPDALARYNCIRFTGNGRMTWSLLVRGKPCAVPVSGNFECNQGMPALEACLAGLGLGQFLSYQVVEHIRAGRLVPLLTDCLAPAQPINVVYPHAGLLPARIRVFVDWIRQSVGETAFSLD
ncbi:LysR family transcriptional regulator [Chitinolyticbacter meiyuanensis]|uniref:LysR family transcriptional regulator n=1 Tax=Chitinolyticbacter meiyuanensis TaxID=682798 RepID=UPI0011E5A445|nr:LysR family transcriptional regulator [Chitinolyticbacter meiyuanensis]